MTEETKCGPRCQHDDKANFASGPWHDEPDRVEFQHAGFDCLIHRTPTGHLCGYVAVPPKHPAFKLDYEEVEAKFEINVHGGLTYADKCQGPICHVPSPGQPDDVWWLGFDCAHAGDHIPIMSKIRGDHYRNLDYVKAQTEGLAEQLAAVAKEGNSNE